MRVLFVAPFGAPRCGEAEYARIWARELEKIGVDITRWDGYWPSVYARGHQYLPDDANAYNLIHVSWGPANMGHYLPQRFPSNVPLSIFLADVQSTTLLHARADLVFAVEPAWRAIPWNHPIPPYEGPFVDRVGLPEEIVIGVSGIRDDKGHKEVIDLAAKRGWTVNAPLHWSRDAWLSTEEEILRLTQSTLNVCWYHSTGRGTSMASTFCLAARRPLLVSGSTMFDFLRPWEGEIYWPGTPPASLEECIERVLADIGARRERWADKVLDELGWARQARRVKEMWEAL